MIGSYLGLWHSWLLLRAGGWRSKVHRVTHCLECPDHGKHHILCRMNLICVQALYIHVYFNGGYQSQEQIQGIYTAGVSIPSSHYWLICR